MADVYRVWLVTADGWSHKFDQGDAPDPAAGEWVLDGLVFGWEVPDFPADVQPEPPVLSFALYSEIGPPPLEEGTDLIFRIEHKDLPTNTAPAVLAMGRGRVSEMVGSPMGDGMSYRVTVVDRSSDLNQLTSTAETAPAEYSKQRVIRQFALAGVEESEWWGINGVAPLAAKDIEAGPLMDLFKECYEDDWGLLPEDNPSGDADRNLSRHVVRYFQAVQGGGEGQDNPAMWAAPWYDGAVVWEREYDMGLYRLVNAGGVYALTLEPFPGARAVHVPAEAVLVDAIEWRRDFHTPNRAELSGSFTTMGGQVLTKVTVQDDDRVAAQGVITARKDSALQMDYAARAAAVGMIGDGYDARPRWRFDKFTVRPDLMPDRGASLAGSMLFPPVLYSQAYDIDHNPANQGVTCIGRVVLVTGVAPQWNPNAAEDVAGRLAGAELRIDNGRLAITCTLAARLPRPWNPVPDVAGLTPRTKPLRWSDLAAMGNPTWQQLDPTITWADLRLTRAN